MKFRKLVLSFLDIGFFIMFGYITKMCWKNNDLVLFSAMAIVLLYRLFIWVSLERVGRNESFKRNRGRGKKGGSWL